MGAQSKRLFFIDAMRAWAILMMLQGHFIDGLLDPIFRNPEHLSYSIWLYFRGITAPVFFTVSGFIFTYLLLRSPQVGFENPRIKKGIRRGVQLLLIGYLLRFNLFGLFKGELYSSFYLVDVLHCIGLSILVIIGIYLFSASKKTYVFPALLIGITLLLFLFEPLYKQWSFAFLPTALANYFTKANGSVFTILPWLGYATIGGFLSLWFTKFKNNLRLYPVAIGIAITVGTFLIFFSSPAFVGLYELTGISLFQLIQSNNYLFIRLGDVFLVFAVFMLIRRILTHPTILTIGASTLSIYVIHFIVLYGSFTGLGLYKFLHHQLTPWWAISGAVGFMALCTFSAIQYGKRETAIKARLSTAMEIVRLELYAISKLVQLIAKNVVLRLRIFINRLFAITRN